MNASSSKRHLLLLIAIISGLLFLLPALSSDVDTQGFAPSKIQLSAESLAKKTMPELVVSWNSTFKTPYSLTGIRSVQLPPQPQAISTYFSENFSQLYTMKNPDKEIQTGTLIKNSKGFSSLSLYQKYESVPVYGVSLKLRLNRENKLESVLGKWISGIDIKTKPALNQKQAVEKLASQLRKKSSGKLKAVKEFQLKPDKMRLIIFNPAIYGDAASKNYLAYHVIIKTWIFFIDANSGEIIHTYSNMQNVKNRNTHNSSNCFSLPGTPILNESGPVDGAVPDAETNNAHNFAGQVYDYYMNTHSRDSYDNSGSVIVATVHSGVPLNPIEIILCCIFDPDSECCGGCVQANAAWHPVLNQMIYGDGGTLDDGRAFNPFTDALDVVAHEMTHGVIQYSIFDGMGDPVGLDYTGQSGALNESYSDVFGAMVDRNDWLMGEDLVTAGYPAGAMRNLADPGNGGAYNPADPDGSARSGHQPDHMDDYVSGGDVHINSGIHNKVAYLLAQGGTHPHSSVVVNGIGRSATERILYQVLTNHLTQTATFLEAREASLTAVGEVYPGSDYKYANVWNAFVAVGICNPATAGHCDVMAYPPKPFNWLDIFKSMFSSTADLNLFREYRDTALAKSELGSKYTAELYNHSGVALSVLINNPQLLSQLRGLINVNKAAVLNARNGDKAIIDNTDSITIFLDNFAKESPHTLQALAYEVRGELLNKRKAGEPFLGFTLN